MMILETMETQKVSIQTSDRFYRVLEIEALHQGLHPQELARIAFEFGLRHLRQQRMDVDMQAYVAEVAGTTDDYDPAVEDAGLEVWASGEAREP